MLERIAGGEHAGRLEAQLLRRHASRSRDDVREAVQEAFTRAHQKCRGTTEGEVYTWVWRTANHCLIDRHRSAEREVVVAGDSRALTDAVDPALTPEVSALRDEGKRELRRLFEDVVGGLPIRQREVLALHSRGLKRPEVARRLGTSPRVVKRDLERILEVARATLLERAGDGCEVGRGRVVRFAFGLARGAEAAQAQLHLMECRRCSCLFERLESWREAAAAVAPLPVERQFDLGLLDRIGEKVTDGVVSVKQHATGASTQVKQQATGIYARAVDATPLAGARPGAAATAIAGCLALGGGATYCVGEGVDPIDILRIDTGPPGKERVRHAANESVQTEAAPPTITPPVPIPKDAPPPSPPEHAPPAAQPQEPSPPPPPPPEQVFEPAAPVQASASSPTPSSSPSQPTPAPSSGVGEFGGP